MAIIKVQSEGINLADTFAFTGTFSPDNTPNFLAYRSSSTQAMTQNANNDIIMNAEAFDTDSAYDTSTGKFTCPVGKAGKYFFTAGISLTNPANQVHTGFHMRNSGGTTVGAPYTKPDFNMNYQNQTGASVMSIVCEMEEGYTINPTMYTNSTSIAIAVNRSYFGGYKLIGV